MLHPSSNYTLGLALSIPRRTDKRDVWNAYLLDENTHYAGKWELPALPPSTLIPEQLIRYTDTRTRHEPNAVIHCYQDDYKFGVIWNNPGPCIKRFQKFAGAIGPDFSVYREMPLNLQLSSVYRSRAISYWWARNGITVIPNVVWGDARTYEFCWDGLPTNSVLAVSTLGSAKHRIDKEIFAAGFLEMLDRLTPSDVIVYGAYRDDMIPPLWASRTNIHHFPGHTTQMYRGKEA